MALKKEIELLKEHEDKLSEAEVKIDHLLELTSKIEIKLDSFIDGAHDKYSILWKKLEYIDKRINDNFKFLIGTIFSLFAGLYATAFSNVIFKALHHL